MTTRLEKLRAMAEHPRSDPNEAALARAEIERLKAQGGGSTQLGAIDFAALDALPLDEVARRTTVEEFGRYCGSSARFRRWQNVDWEGIRRSQEDERRRHARGIRYPGEAGYYEWARSLAVGDLVGVRRSGAGVGVWSSDVTAILRVTPTQYVVGDGRRFRRTGNHPGYRVGETGRDGSRTYLVAIDADTKRTMSGTQQDIAAERAKRRSP